MIITLLNIDNQHQIIVSVIFNNITEELRVITESTTDEQITAFIFGLESDQESRREVLNDNYFPRSKRRNLHYHLLNLQHYNAKLQTWKWKTWNLGKATFSCSPESTNFAFIESIFKNPPPTKIVSMYHTIWVINNSLNEPNRNHFKSTWW